MCFNYEVYAKIDVHMKTWSARTDIVEEGHTLSHQLKRSVLHMAREGITATLKEVMISWLFLKTD